MADIRVDVEQVKDSGLSATNTGSLTTSDTYLVNNDGRTVLHFKKDQASDATITIETPRTVGGLAVADRTVTIPGSTGDVFVGPLAPGLYNTGQDVKFTISGDVAGLTVAALRV